MLPPSVCWESRIMTQFRWMSKVVVGSWKNSKNEALCDALEHGHASVTTVKGLAIVLRPFTSIERRKKVAA